MAAVQNQETSDGKLSRPHRKLLKRGVLSRGALPPLPKDID